jgi:MFS family permease
MLFALLPPLVRRVGLPDSTIGWIFSLSALLWMFTSPFWGRLSDQTGRKPIVASGLMAYAISMSAFALVMIAGLNGALGGALLFAGLLLTRAIFGAFGSATNPAAAAYIADRTSLARRTEALAALTAAFALGQAVGPAFAGALATRTGLVFPIVFIAACAALAALAVLRFLPEKRDAAPRAKRGVQTSALKLARDPRLAPYLLFGFAMSAVTGVLTQIFTLFLMDRLDIHGEHGAELAAAGFTLHALMLLATQLLLLPRLKLNSRMLMAAGAVLVAVGVGVQIAAAGFITLMAAQLIQGLGFGLARPGYAGGASLAVSTEEQGAAAGLVISMNGAGYIFSPLIGGVAYEHLGINTPLYFSLAILAAMVAFALLSRRLRR